MSQDLRRVETEQLTGMLLEAAVTPALILAIERLGGAMTTTIGELDHGTAGKSLQMSVDRNTGVLTLAVLDRTRPSA